MKTLAIFVIASFSFLSRGYAQSEVCADRTNEVIVPGEQLTFGNSYQDLQAIQLSGKGPNDTHASFKRTIVIYNSRHEYSIETTVSSDEVSPGKVPSVTIPIGTKFTVEDINDDRNQLTLKTENRTYTLNCGSAQPNMCNREYLIKALGFSGLECYETEALPR